MDGRYGFLKPEYLFQIDIVRPPKCHMHGLCSPFIHVVILNPFHESKAVRIQLAHIHIKLHMYLRVTKRAIESKSEFLAQPTEIILYNIAFV